MRHKLLVLGIAMGLLTFGVAGCDDDDTNNNTNNNSQECSCQLEILSVDGSPVDQLGILQEARDDVSDEPGFQVSVEVGYKGDCNLDSVTLTGGIHSEDASLVGGDGEWDAIATFEAYTIPSGAGEISLVARTEKCASEPVKLRLLGEQPPECHIVGGVEKDQEYSCPDDDEAPGVLGLQRNIQVECKAMSVGTEVQFYVDGNLQGTAQLDAAGRAEKAVTLPVTGVCHDNVSIEIRVQYEGTTYRDVVYTGRACCLGVVPCSLTWDPTPLQNTPANIPTFNRTSDIDDGTVGLQVRARLHTLSSEVSSIDLMVSSDGGQNFSLVTSVTPNEDDTELVVTLPEGDIIVKPVCTKSGNDTIEDPSQSWHLLVDTVPPAAPEAFNCHVTDSHKATISCTIRPSGEDAYGVDVRYTAAYDATQCESDELGLIESWSSLSSVPNLSSIGQPPFADGTDVQGTFEPFTPKASGGYCLAAKVMDSAGNWSEPSDTSWNEIKVGYETLNYPGPSDATNIFYGNSITAVDLNCDGRRDLVVGAFGVRLGGILGAGDGEVYVYFAKADGSGYPTTPDLVISSAWMEDEFFGWAVANMGNFTGHTDSADDSAQCEDLVISGDYMRTSDTSDQWHWTGAVYILRGRPNWNHTHLYNDEDPSKPGVDAIIYYENPEGYNPNYTLSERFGYALANAGDFNGDGNADLAIAAPGAVPYGAVYIMYGPLNIPFRAVGTGPTILHAPADVDFTFRGVSDILAEENYEELGISLSAAGDLNGDGYDDLLIGAIGKASDPNADDATRQEYHSYEPSKAYILLGGDDATTVDASPTAPFYDGSRFAVISSNGTIPTSALGRAVAGLGDFNQDGFLDIAVSDPFYDDPNDSDAEHNGALYIFFGDGTVHDMYIEDADLKIMAPFAGDQTFGASIAPSVEQANAGVLGDFNGDGVPDLMVGAQHFGDYDGSVLMWLGSSNYTTSSGWLTYETASFWLTPPSRYGYWGIVVTWIGDVNGDGYVDFAVGDNMWDGYYNQTPSNKFQGRVSYGM